MESSHIDFLAQHAAQEGFISLNADGNVTVHPDIPSHIANELNHQVQIADGVVVESTPSFGVDPVDPAFERMLEEHARRVAALKLAVATNAIKRAWEQMGGPRCALGLPLEADIQAHKDTEGYVAHFRAGYLHVSPAGLNPTVLRYKVVNMNLVGLECQIRQEGTDEIYGVVSAIGPSGSTVATRRFPDSGTISMGPDGLRISNLDLPIINGGIVQSYRIIATLFEHDSGDVDVIAGKVVDKIASTVASAIGGLTGAPAEAVADSESFKQSLVSGLAWIFGDILGMGDDPYNPESEFIDWSVLQSDDQPAVQPAIHRDDDPRTIENWTHRLILSGVDDGGDQGRYGFYFRVWTNTITMQ